METEDAALVVSMLPGLGISKGVAQRAFYAFPNIAFS
jgi:hypothetical protein